MLSLLVFRHSSAEEAKTRFSETGIEYTKLADFKAITGMGDEARRYTKTGVSGDPVLSVELIKGRLNVVMYNSKVKIGDMVVGPVCDLDKLEELAKAVTARLP